MQFLSEEHKENFKKLVGKAKINKDDTERKALFFIIAGNSSLNEQVGKIYNFSKNETKTEYDEDGQIYVPKLMLSGSTEKLINLGIELYSEGTKKSVMDTFSGLDTNNFTLAINAIMLRFNM